MEYIYSVFRCLRLNVSKGIADGRMKIGASGPLNRPRLRLYGQSATILTNILIAIAHMIAVFQIEFDGFNWKKSLWTFKYSFDG